jgi:hypothetical protein
MIVVQTPGGMLAWQMRCIVATAGKKCYYFGVHGNLHALVLVSCGNVKATMLEEFVSPSF